MQDGLGSSGSTKPDPMMKYVQVSEFIFKKTYTCNARIKMSGTFKDLTVVNSPQRCFSIGNDAALTISGVVVDNCKYIAFFIKPEADGLKLKEMQRTPRATVNPQAIIPTVSTCLRTMLLVHNHNYLTSPTHDSRLA